MYQFLLGGVVDLRWLYLPIPNVLPWLLSLLFVLTLLYCNFGLLLFAHHHRRFRRAFSILFDAGFRWLDLIENGIELFRDSFHLLVFLVVG